MKKSAHYNEEAELACLGCMALHPEATDIAAGILKGDDFYLPQNGLLFRHITDMRETGIDLDPVTFGEYLETVGVLKDVGGYDYLNKVLESVPHIEHVRYYAEIVLKHSRCRRVILACRKTIEDANRVDAEPQDLVERASGRIEEIMEGGAQEIRHVQTVIDDMHERNRQVITPIGTGLPELDMVLDGGFRPSQLVVVAARPSMGKTSMGVQIAKAAAAEGHPALFSSIEMEAEELTGRMTPADLDEVVDYPLMFDDVHSYLSEICNAARIAKRRHGIEVVVVDYLQKIRVEGQQKLFDKIEQITSTSKRLAKELRIPVVLLAQLSRAAEQRDDKKPRLTDLKGSGAIEEDADTVLLLHRPEYYDEEDRPGEADIIVAKNRSGQRNVTVPVGFDADNTRFVPYHQRPHQVREYFAG